MAIECFEYFKFWQIRKRFYLYLCEASHPNLRRCLAFHRYGIFCILLLYFFIHFILLLIPFSPRIRLALHDLVLFYDLPQLYNWIFTFFALDSLFFQYNMILRSSGKPETMIMLWNILYRNTDRGYFLQRNVTFKGKQMCAVSCIQMIAKGALRRVNYFAFYVVYLLSFYHLNSLKRVFQDWRFYLTTLSGYAHLLSVFTTSLITDLQIITFASLHINWCAVSLFFTKVIALQFISINSLLIGAPSGAISPIQFSRFRKYHTGSVVLILKFNRFFGTLLLGFLLLNLPINGFAIMSLFLGHFRPLAAIVFTNFAAMQFIIFGYFHLLAGKYTTKIHACRSPLYGLQASRSNWKYLERLRLSLYIDKYNGPQFYGITYASLGLMSIQSFCKFLDTYAQLILYWYRLISN